MDDLLKGFLAFVNGRETANSPLQHEIREILRAVVEKKHISRAVLDRMKKAWGSVVRLSWVGGLPDEYESLSPELRHRAKESPYRIREYSISGPSIDGRMSFTQDEAYYRLYRLLRDEKSLGDLALCPASDCWNFFLKKRRNEKYCSKRCLNRDKQRKFRQTEKYQSEYKPTQKAYMEHKRYVSSRQAPLGKEKTWPEIRKEQIRKRKEGTKNEAEKKRGKEE